MTRDCSSTPINTVLVAIAGAILPLRSRRFPRSGGSRSKVLRTATLMLLSVVAFSLTPLSSSYAATIMVDTVGDPGLTGTCDLRDAITAANTETATNNCAAGSGTDTIQFSLSGTITLSNTLPAIANVSPGSLTIDGSGQAITLDGASAYEIFSVNSGATLNLQFLTLANGAASSGGAIANDGTLTVTNSTFSANQANGELLHIADGYGGAILNDGTLTVTGSTFSANQANAGGGAIENSPTETLTVTNSTFSSNSAEGGGAISNNTDGTLTVTNSTFSSNSASDSAGGAINNLGTVNLKGTILAASTGGNCAGNAVTDAGYNISDDSTCDFTIAPSGTSINGSTTVFLDPAGLHSNGGPTQTIALEPDSEAVDFIPVADCTDQSPPEPLTTDQRGFPRPAPGNPNFCDAGAYELQQPCSVTYNGNFNGNLTISKGLTCIINGTVTRNVKENGGGLFTSNATIGGNLQIAGGGTFSIGAGTIINGNLQIQDVSASSAQDQVCASSVNGNLQFQNDGTAVQIGSASKACAGDQIGGNLQVENNTGSMQVFDNIVKGNLQVTNNTAAAQVFDNIVAGNLQCSGNSSITGGGDTAASLQGQCAGF